MQKKQVQITSGRGPSECELAVAHTLKAMIAEMKVNKIDHSIIETVSGFEKGTFASVNLELRGESLFPFVSRWLGTILWISKSEYRPDHKRKNWFIAINEITKENEVFEIGEIVYTTSRASGPGGQNVNKVETAVRATHVLSGTSVLVSETRSQIQNKKIAYKRLLETLQKSNETQELKRQTEIWNQHNGNIRMKPNRIFEGKNFKEKNND